MDSRRLSGSRGQAGSRARARAKRAGGTSVVGAAEDVLGVDLEDPVTLGLGTGHPRRVGTAPPDRGVVGPLVLPDDALPAPDEVTLEQPPAVGVTHDGVDLGLREAGPVRTSGAPDVSIGEREPDRTGAGLREQRLPRGAGRQSAGSAPAVPRHPCASRVSAGAAVQRWPRRHPPPRGRRQPSPRPTHLAEVAPRCRPAPRPAAQRPRATAPRLQAPVAAAALRPAPDRPVEQSHDVEVRRLLESPGSGRPQQRAAVTCEKAQSPGSARGEGSRPVGQCLYRLGRPHRPRSARGSDRCAADRDAGRQPALRAVKGSPTRLTAVGCPIVRRGRGRHRSDRNPQARSTRNASHVSHDMPSRESATR